MICFKVVMYSWYSYLRAEVSRILVLVLPYLLKESFGTIDQPTLLYEIDNNILWFDHWSSVMTLAHQDHYHQMTQFAVLHNLSWIPIQSHEEEIRFHSTFFHPFKCVYKSGSWFARTRHGKGMDWWIWNCECSRQFITHAPAYLRILGDCSVSLQETGVRKYTDRAPRIECTFCY